MSTLVTGTSKASTVGTEALVYSLAPTAPATVGTVPVAPEASKGAPRDSEVRSSKAPNFSTFF